MLLSLPLLVCLAIGLSFLAAGVASADDGSTTSSPNVGQIHLALGESPSSMSVQWSTSLSYSESGVVYYGLACNSMSSSVSASAFNFTDSGEKKYTQVHHVGVMSSLKPSTTYYYKVGSDSAGYSDVFSFTSLPVVGPLAKPLRFGVWGDLGLKNAQIFPYVRDEVSSGNFDVLVHVGDFAYDLHTNDGTYGDEFMNLIMPLAANV